MGKASRRKQHGLLKDGRPIRCAPLEGGVAFTYHQEGDVTMCIRGGAKHEHYGLTQAEAEVEKVKLRAQGAVADGGLSPMVSLGGRLFD